NQAVALQLARGGDTTLPPQGPREEPPVVHAVQSEQVHVPEAEISQGLLDRLEEIFRTLVRRHFGLHDDSIARQRRQNGAKLHLGRAVAARGFEVIYAQFKRPANYGFDVPLVFFGDVTRTDILPFELVTHPAAGTNGHLQFRAAKASVFHRATNSRGTCLGLTLQTPVSADAGSAHARRRGRGNARWTRGPSRRSRASSGSHTYPRTGPPGRGPCRGRTAERIAPLPRDDRVRSECWRRECPRRSCERTARRVCGSHCRPKAGAIRRSRGPTRRPGLHTGPALRSER